MYHQIKGSLISLSSSLVSPFTTRARSLTGMWTPATLQKTWARRDCSRKGWRFLFKPKSLKPEVHQRHWGPSETLRSTRDPGVHQRPWDPPEKTRQGQLLLQWVHLRPHSGLRAPLLPTSDSWQTVRNWSQPRPVDHTTRRGLKPHPTPCAANAALWWCYFRSSRCHVCFLLSVLTKANRSEALHSLRPVWQLKQRPSPVEPSDGEVIITQKHTSAIKSSQLLKLPEKIYFMI